jgi:hypothetical protein
MPSGPRELLENRFDQLASELESQFDRAREQARREQAEQLNQAVRRLAIAPDPEELLATLASAAARFATGVAVFRIAAGNATNERLEVPLSAAPALAAAIESRDPLIAAAIPSELGGAILDMYVCTPESRVSIFPLVAADLVPALLLAWGAEQVPAIELLTKFASAIWSAFPVSSSPLIFITPSIAPPPEPIPDAGVPARAPSKAAAWEELPPREQQLHLRAQRFARVQVAHMRLDHAEAVQVGRSRRDLYKGLHLAIEDARQAFRAQFFDSCPSMVDYLHLELKRTLANDDADLLGSDYPGPIV